MDFTREPIIETIVTPKEGCKIVVRSSKAVGQEEYFVDAVEIVSFGHALFFRSLEKPKSFLVPVSDYELLEVREARMVLKNTSPDRAIKIGGGREAGPKGNKEIEKQEVSQLSEEGIGAFQQQAETAPSEAPAPRPEGRLDKKREKRRHYKKRRNGKEETTKEESEQEVAVPPLEDEGKIPLPEPQEGAEKVEAGAPSLTPGLLSSLLQPPTTLISETIKHYRENALFKNAFFLTEEEQYKPHEKVNELLNEEEDFTPPSFKDGTFEAEDEQHQNVEHLNHQSERENVEQTTFDYDREEGQGVEQQYFESEKKEEEIPLYSEESFNGIKGDEEPFFPTSEEQEPELEKRDSNTTVGHHEE